MFKIKVGLKSFRTDSIQKSKHQIGRIAHYLKQSPVSSQSVKKETRDLFMLPLARKRAITLTRTPHSRFWGIKGQLGSPTLAESSSIAGVGLDSGLILAQQMHLRDPIFHKHDNHDKNIYKRDGQGERLRRMSPHKARTNNGLSNLENQKTKRMSPSNAVSMFHMEDGSIHRMEDVSLLGKEGWRGFKENKSTPINDVLLDRKQDISSCLHGDNFFGITPLPTLVKKITTLRSPHIDKKSREQFEWKRQKAQVHFDLNSVAQISLVLFILTHSRFPGVEIEIGVESRTYLA